MREPLLESTLITSGLLGSGAELVEGTKLKLVEFLEFEAELVEGMELNTPFEEHFSSLASGSSTLAAAACGSGVT